MTVLNLSFCQFIEYQDAHANLSTESTDYILNSVFNFTTFLERVAHRLYFPSVLLVLYICSFSLGLNIGFKL